jgi:hypothetical protein
LSTAANDGDTPTLGLGRYSATRTRRHARLHRSSLKPGRVSGCRRANKGSRASVLKLHAAAALGWRSQTPGAMDARTTTNKPVIVAARAISIMRWLRIRQTPDETHTDPGQRLFAIS